MYFGIHYLTIRCNLNKTVGCKYFTFSDSDRPYSSRNNIVVQCFTFDTIYAKLYAVEKQGAFCS